MGSQQRGSQQGGGAGGRRGRLLMLKQSNFLPAAPVFSVLQ